MRGLLIALLFALPANLPAIELEEAEADTCPKGMLDWSDSEGGVICPTQRWWVIIPKDPGGTTWMGDSHSIVKPLEAHLVYKGDKEPRDPGLRSVWFHRFYPVVGKDGDKSAKLQWHMDCEKKTWRPVKYIDLDASYKTLDSGNIEEIGPIPVEPGYISETLFNFTCNSAAYRKAKYTEVDSVTNYREVAEFFNDPRDLSKTVRSSASPPDPGQARARSTANMTPSTDYGYDASDRAAGAKYQQCVSASAKKFATSKEEAPVVAQSALQNCEALRASLYSKIREKNPYKLAKAIIKKIDERFLAEAQLIVVRSRSGK